MVKISSSQTILNSAQAESTSHGMPVTPAFPWLRQENLEPYDEFQASLKQRNNNKNQLKQIH